MRANNCQIARFKRWISKTDLSPVGGEVDNGYAFALSDLPSSTDFTNLFDAYRITEIEFVLVPIISETNTADTIGSPLVWTAVDFDSAGAQAITALQQYDTCQLHNGLKDIVVKFKPRAAMAAYAGAFTSYAEATEGQWFDCASPGVQYFGLLVDLAQGAGNTQTYKISARYTVECKRQR
jgi:hypothetical protein